MNNKITQIETPNRFLKLGDVIEFFTLTPNTRRAPYTLNEVRVEDVKTTYIGTITEFSIGTDMLRGRHEIIICCSDNRMISCKEPGRKGKDGVINIYDYRNILRLL